MIELSPHIHSQKSPDPGQAQTPKALKQNGLGIFAKLLAGLRGDGPVSDGPMSDGPGSELRGEVPETEAALEGAVSGKGKGGTAKKAAPREGVKTALSGESERTQKKTGPKKADSAGSEEDRALLDFNSAAALQGIAPGETAPSEPAEAGEEVPAREEISLSGPASGGIAGEEGGGGELIPELSAEPFREAAARDQARIFGEGKSRLKGGRAADVPGNPSDIDLTDQDLSALDPAELYPAEQDGGVENGLSRLGRPGEKEPGAAQEARNGKKGRERLSLEVRDLRAGQDPAVPVSQEHRSTGEAASGREVEFTVELRSGGRIPGEPNPLGEGRSPAVFTDLLARELNQNLNGDIVRHASIMLRDGGEGTIRLSLKPESLGTVKIRLEMAENKIAGQIIVESDEALRAFEREIRSLEQAFRDSGFEGASLEMALAGDGGQNGAGRQWQEGEARPFFSPRLAASSYDAAGETAGYAEPDPLGGFPAGRTGGGRPAMPQVNMLV